MSKKWKDKKKQVKFDEDIVAKEVTSSMPYEPTHLPRKKKAKSHVKDSK